MTLNCKGCGKKFTLPTYARGDDILNGDISKVPNLFCPNCQDNPEAKEQSEVALRLTRALMKVIEELRIEGMNGVASIPITVPRIFEDQSSPRIIGVIIADVIALDMLKELLPPPAVFSMEWMRRLALKKKGEYRSAIEQQAEEEQKNTQEETEDNTIPFPKGVRMPGNGTVN